MTAAEPTTTEYYRRRIDELIDGRLKAIEHEQGIQGEALDRIEGRINVLFGALGLLTLVVNIVGPWLGRLLT